MTTITRAATVGEWQTDRLDLDAYLERIGYIGERAADAGTLRDLHRAHADTIAFENLDVVLGRPIELDLDSVQDKLVRRLRGGYCFEHNLLFGAALERLGYAVTRLAARVQPAGPGPRTHMLLRVAADGREWLADVGFGASLLEPLALEATTVCQGSWTYRLTPGDPEAWLLQAGRPEGWADLYGFTLEPQRRIDYDVYNHYTATHPRSPFAGQIVALRTTPDVKHALRGRLLTATRPSGATEEQQLSIDETIDVLCDLFAIRLDATEIALLRSSSVRAVRPADGR
ncbi:arylamine N-acetyltransferase [soil metagenome]